MSDILNFEENILEICEKYTKLTMGEIEFLNIEARRIMNDEKNLDKDVFIDVRNVLTGEAIVVCHRKPCNQESLYKEKVVGKVAYRRDEPGPLRTLETSQTSVDLYARSQEGVLIKQTSYPIRYKNKTIAVLIAEEDFGTDLKPRLANSNQCDSLKEFELGYEDLRFFEKSITNYIDDSILIFNKNGILLHHNKAAEHYYKEFGYLNSIDGLHFNNLSLDLLTFEHISNSVEKGDYESFRYREIKFGEYYFKSKIVVLPNKGIVIQTIKDVTDEKIKESLVKEELVAIQEIHHRVKNNLQTVVSLLRLQSRRVSSSEAKKALDESVNRVLSIAATHELLSKQKEDDVQLKMVLNSVIFNLSRFYSNNLEVNLQINIDEAIVLTSNKAVTIALVMNELIQNCYDHAFVGKEIGSSKINIEVKQEKELILIFVKDNGIGFDFDKITQHNLGLQIVTSFVESKLNGMIVVNSDESGTRTKIIFKN